MKIDYDDVRIEQDSLGELAVRSSSLWGVQTERAIRNFDISGVPIGRFKTLIVALAMIKAAAARANHGLGVLSAEKREAIEAACDELIAGGYASAFPVDAIQGGAGTSVNMNANEVIANIANEKAGLGRGTYGFIHPNDDVNRSQSTNDVYPSAVKLSLLMASRGMAAALADLAASLDERAAAFQTIGKLGRTQLQDAVPMTLGQEFAAFATVIRKGIDGLEDARRGLYELNLGGTAIGTGLNAPAGYAEAVLAHLREISGFSFANADDLIAANWDMAPFVNLSGALKQIGTRLSKIANDVRLLSSGPRGGIGEIRLPEAQPGSSIMPGKVNPVIPEVVSQVCFQVFGHDVAVTAAAEAGQLQLNAMEPLIAYNLHQSLQLLERAVITFDTLCVRGIEANEAQCKVHLDASVGAATALVPYIGYAKSAQLAKDALATGRTIAELALERRYLTPETLHVIDPLALAHPRAQDA